MTADHLDAQIRGIRELMTADDDGSLWTLFFEDPNDGPVMAHVIDDAMRQPDRRWLPNFARVLERVDAWAYLLAVIRDDGRPRPEDRELWTELQALLGSHNCRVLGFLVVGTTSVWCAPGGDAPAAA